MRRGIVSSVLFALALAIQALAPATASVAMARIAAGARCATPTEATIAVAVRHGEAAEHHSVAVCGLCQFCCATAASVGARPVSADMAVLAPVSRAFMPQRSVAADIGRRFTHRARAPPRLS